MYIGFTNESDVEAVVYRPVIFRQSFFQLLWYLKKHSLCKLIEL